MGNNLDVNNLLAAINNGDLKQSINRLQQALSLTRIENNEQTRNNTQSRFIIPEDYRKHLDQRINLIMALIPLLSRKKQERAEELLKLSTPGYF